MVTQGFDSRTLYAAILNNYRVLSQWSLYLVFAWTFEPEIKCSAASGHAGFSLCECYYCDF